MMARFFFKVTPCLGGLRVGLLACAQPPFLLGAMEVRLCSAGLGLLCVLKDCRAPALTLSDLGVTYFCSFRNCFADPS